MKTLNLPKPIAEYFEADKQDGRSVARCFTEDAVVTDEGKSHRGHTEITAWKNAASAEFSYVVELLTFEENAKNCIVNGRVSGNFPGSPTELKYNFILESGKIASLEITL